MDHALRALHDSGQTVIRLIDPGIRAIVFDAVGTLIHPRPAAPLVYAEIGRRFGSCLTTAVIAERFRKAFRQEEDVDRQHGYQTGEARELSRWRTIVASVLDDVSDREACFQALFAHFAHPDAWQCDPQGAAVIAALAKSGYLLGMASNYDGRLRTVAAGLPALDVLGFLVISSEVGWRKPAPEFFQALVRSAGLRAQEILHVGDDPGNDYVGARNAGLPAILFDADDRVHDPSVVRIKHLGQLASY
jgi:putative hydrolase of the HAD superfamily